MGLKNFLTLELQIKYILDGHFSLIIVNRSLKVNVYII